MVWYSELARRILPHPTPTPAGDKPPRYIFSFRHRPSVYKSARFAGGEPASRLIGGHIPDRSPGHAFVRMTNSVAGTIHFRTNRSSWPASAHHGVKIEVSISGVVCGSFATRTPPLDSRFRGNDESGDLFSYQ